MRTATLILALGLATAGCAPRLAGANAVGGIIQRSGSIGTDRAFALAKEHCGRYGKIYEITNQDILTNTWRFECVEPQG
jgi:hypothetical protein